MTEMVSSRFDDVAVNGCASVAKLAAASNKTRYNMAASSFLVSALLHAVIGDTPLSLDTRTNAAVALSELTVESGGQVNLLAAAVDDEGKFLKLLALGRVAESHETETATMFLRAYWYG